MPAANDDLAPYAARRDKPTGLVLMGGGARAAYQVGVLAAIMAILDPQRKPGFLNPFPIICGTSAGAINAAALACRAHRPRLALKRMRRLWESLHTGMVYRADAPAIVRTGARWLGLMSLGWMMSGASNRKPRSLLDNTPLSELLDRVLELGRLRANLSRGFVHGLAVTALGYNSGEHLTFYQSNRPIEPWHRFLRRAVPTAIGIDHLMASSAIPFVFPARAVHMGKQVEWCGDGSMRQLAPISPAIHLGAHRVLVIGTGYRDDTHPREQDDAPPYPSLAQVAGHALSSMFLDSLSTDLERLERVNSLLQYAALPDGASVRRIEVLALTPSQSLDELALAHLDDLPREVRTLFRVLGVSPDAGGSGGGALLSYLLFESGYTRRLIELGYVDTMRRIEEVTRFFEEARA